MAHNLKIIFEVYVITCLRFWSKKSQIFCRIRVQKFFYRLVWLNWLTILNTFVANWGTLKIITNQKMNLRDNKIKTLQVCSFWMNVGTSIWKYIQKAKTGETFFLDFNWFRPFDAQSLMPHFYFKLFDSTFFIRIKQLSEKNWY